MTVPLQPGVGTSAAPRVRLLLVLLACWWSLAGTGYAARFRGSWDRWQIAVGGKGRPSVRRVLSEVGAFALRHGFVRHPEWEFSGNNYTLDQITFLPVQERRYTFEFEPAKKSHDPDLQLMLTHNGNEPFAELSMMGPVDERAWQYMEQFRADFLREFSARYGKGRVEEIEHLHTDR